jgi:ribosomal protein S18 acetylase RimI-like enzyme
MITLSAPMETITSNLVRAKANDSVEYFDIYRHAIWNSRFFGFQDHIALGHFLESIEGAKESSASFIEVEGIRIGILELGQVDFTFGISQFGIIPGWKKFSIEAIRSVSKVLSRNHKSIRAIYEEQYHSFFEKAGFSFIGSRTNMCAGVGLTYPSVGRRGTHGFRLLSEFEKKEIANCLFDAHKGGTDLKLGLYTPYTIDAFLDYVESIFSGGEGTLIEDACVAIGTPGDLKGLLIIASNIKRSQGVSSAVVVEFVVHPNYQRMGLGQSLMNYASDALTKCGYTRLDLQYASHNVKARRLYRKMGFELDGERVFRAELHFPRLREN